MINRDRTATIYKLLLVAGLVLATMLPGRTNLSAQSTDGANTQFLPLIEASGERSNNNTDRPQLIESDDDVRYQSDENENSEEDIQGLVVGGFQAYNGQFPYMVSTRHNGGHRCGGTLIAPKYVLTAHHCYYDISFNITVALGAHAISGTGASQIIPVSKRHFYQSTTLSQVFNGGHDIMILELAYPATLNSRVQVLPYNTDVAFGHSGTTRAIGWGATCSTCGGAYYLKYVDMPLNGPNGAWDIDAGSSLTYQTTCFGDSGGPYIKNGILIGVTSYTYGPSASRLCSGSAGITDVAKHAEWIRGVIGGAGISPTPRPTPRPTVAPPQPTPRPTVTPPQPTPQPKNNCNGNYLCMFDASGFGTNLASLYMPEQSTGYWLNLSQIGHANGNWANRVSSAVNNTNHDALMYDKDGIIIYKLRPGQSFTYMGNSVDYAYLCPTSGCWPVLP